MDAFKLAELAVFRGACQKLRELTPLVALLRRRKLHTVLEIGTMTGGTLWLWCQLALPDAVVVSVDLPGRYSLPLAATAPDRFEKARFVRELRSLGAWTDHTQATMALVGDEFTRAQLSDAIDKVRAEESASGKREESNDALLA